MKFVLVCQASTAEILFIIFDVQILFTVYKSCTIKQLKDCNLDSNTHANLSLNDNNSALYYAGFQSNHINE